jgi:hypothetical protein
MQPGEDKVVHNYHVLQEHCARSAGEEGGGVVGSVSRHAGMQEEGVQPMGSGGRWMQGGNGGRGHVYHPMSIDGGGEGGGGVFG